MMIKNNRQISLKRYSGVILLSCDNEFVLQKRENKTDISNPGLITTFGGVCKHNETHIDCLIREINEELRYSLNRKNIFHFLNLQKKEMDETYTNCVFYYYSERVQINNLNLTEGEEIIRLKDNSIAKYEHLLSPVCKEVLRKYKSIQS